LTPLDRAVTEAAALVAGIHTAPALNFDLARASFAKASVRRASDPIHQAEIGNYRAGNEEKEV
jgi:hypothetical protein